MDLRLQVGSDQEQPWFYYKDLLQLIRTFDQRFLIEKKYTYKGGIVGYGGRAGGLLMGAVINKAPELFLGMIIQVGYLQMGTKILIHRSMREQQLKK